MSDSKVREDAYDAWTRTVGVSNAPGGNLAMSPLDAWRAAWQASRAAALESGADYCLEWTLCGIKHPEALAMLRPDQRENLPDLSADPYHRGWLDAMRHASQHIRALAGRGA